MIFHKLKNTWTPLTQIQYVRNKDVKSPQDLKFLEKIPRSWKETSPVSESRAAPPAPAC